LPTASNPSSARIPELDGLRGLAILLVILCHYVGSAGSAPLGLWAHRFLTAFTVGWSGVDLFFVLSGFLIGGILLGARNSPHYVRAFYIRRVFRILPIYYLWTLLFVLVVVVAITYSPGRHGITSSDPLRVPVQLLFLQNVFIGMPHFTWTWFVVTWFLAVAWREPRYREWISCDAALLRRARFILFLGLGGLLWWLVHPVKVVTVTIGLTWFSLFYSVLLLVAVSQPAGRLAAAMRVRFLGWLGSISYCVYLLHDALNFFAHAIFSRAKPQIYTVAGALASFLALLATLTLASLSWRYFEKRLIRIGHTYSYANPSSSGIAILGCAPFFSVSRQ
jgi:peptidoglycan/LPS O-acetylase OafA/YrhL